MNHYAAISIWRSSLLTFLLLLSIPVFASNAAYDPSPSSVRSALPDQGVVSEPWSPAPDQSRGTGVIGGVTSIFIDGGWVPQANARVTAVADDGVSVLSTYSYANGSYELQGLSFFTAYTVIACLDVGESTYSAVLTDLFPTQFSAHLLMTTDNENRCDSVPVPLPSQVDLTVSKPVLLNASDPSAWTVGMIVTNTGSVHVDDAFYVDVYIDPPDVNGDYIRLGYSDGFTIVPALAAGASSYLTITIYSPIVLNDMPEIYAMVDSLQQVLETDENNNVSGPVVVQIPYEQVELLMMYALAFDNPDYSLNNLHSQFPETLLGIVNATWADPSKMAVVLVDLSGEGDTHILVVYDGFIKFISGLPDEDGVLDSNLDEYDMGNGRMLGGFMKWARERYPTSKTAFSFIGHGGPLVPETDIARVFLDEQREPTNNGHRAIILPSWVYAHPDFTDYHPINMISPYDLADALRLATNEGQDPIDVVDLVHCFALSVEEAYEIAPYTETIVGSPNYAYYDPVMIGESLQNLDHTMTAAEMADTIAQTYDEVLPDEKHPRILVALDSDYLSTIKEAWDMTSQLVMTAFEQDEAGTKAKIHAAYTHSAKYDTTLCEPDWALAPPDGLSDMADFALYLNRQFGSESDIGVWAMATSRLVHESVIGRYTRDGIPWFAKEGGTHWQFPGAGLALYTDFEPTIVEGSPYLNWQTGWYTDTVTLENPYPYGFIQGSSATWADVMNRFWRGEDMATSACLLTFVLATDEGELSVEEILWPKPGEVEVDAPVWLGATIHSATVVENTAVAFVVTQQDEVVFQDLVDTGYLLTGTHFIAADDVWLPTLEGPYTLQVMVEPDNQIMEPDEHNNVLIMRDTVLAASGNGAFQMSAHLRDHAQWITDLQLTVDIMVEGEGLEEIEVQIYQFDGLTEGVGLPMRVGHSIHPAASELTLTLPENLRPGPLALYLWANPYSHSHGQPVTINLNYVPPHTPLAPGEMACYPFVAAADDYLRISLDVSDGDDANLFMWYPHNYGVPNLIGTRFGDDDFLIESVPLSGEYLLCVYGETAAATTYSLQVWHNDDTSGVPPAHGEGNLAAYIPRQRPYLQQPTPQAPGETRIYLPIMMR